MTKERQRDVLTLTVRETRVKVERQESYWYVSEIEWFANGCTVFSAKF